MSIVLSTVSSGSSGNSNIIASGNTVIMSDCGISLKKALAGLSTLGIKSPDALLVTHSHSDHIKGASLIAKKFDIPIYLTEETLKECSSIPKEYANIIHPGEVFNIKSIDILPFSVSHDTASPVAFTFTDKDSKASVITDTGIMTEDMFNNLKYSESIIIESNHDEKMLAEGPYPYFLKKRISGNKGHISNRVCASVCKALAESGTKKFLLAHLSEHNNTEELAMECTSASLSATCCNYTLKIAKKDVPITL